MEDARLLHERGDRDRVLDQPAKVGVMARARARRAAELRPQIVVSGESRQHGRELGSVDLAREVLEEAVELVEVAVGHGEEVGRVGGSLLDTRDVAQLGLELVAEALDATGHADEVAALEAPGGEVGVAEDARCDRPAPVAQLDGEVGGAGLRRHAVLSRAGEDALDRAPGAQTGYRHAFLGDC
jgi:hypothetical protein